jgi:uncharacterized membrane protein YphA (DoxX/SURF4 family)
VDTRTATRPRESEGADAPFAFAKVPSDPARFTTTTASFRLRLANPVTPLIEAPEFPGGGGLADTQPLLMPPLLLSGAAPAPRRRGRVTPITWTGQVDPGLTQAIRLGPGASLPAQATQLLPRMPVPEPDPLPEELDAYHEPAWEAPEGIEEYLHEPGEPIRHAWYPGRRVDLGLVLLPLRAFLGGISVYAGFSKLCDPVYFQGGARGSMMRWLESLHPWEFARPLVAVAEHHPVGAGLSVAFAQIVVGVLSMLGLWQRFAAAVGMALATALLLTVSWRAVPVYDAPQILYLAAWSPLLLAGAPLFSLDGRLALEAWRRCGSRAPIGQLRRRVVRRGALLVTLIGGSALLLGSLVGSAVRSERTAVTEVPSTPAVPTGYPSPVWPTASPTAPKPGHGHVAKPKPKVSVSPSPTAGHHRYSTGGSSASSSGYGRSTHGSSHSGSPSPTGGGRSTTPSSGSSGGALGGLLG